MRSAFFNSVALFLSFRRSFFLFLLYKMIVSLLTLGLLLIPSSNAFFRLPCAKPVLDARADPIVSFGKASSHAHTIMGSNGTHLFKSKWQVFI